MLLIFQSELQSVGPPQTPAHTSPLLHTLNSPTQQQKTFNETITLRISHQVP